MNFLSLNRILKRKAKEFSRSSSIDEKNIYDGMKYISLLGLSKKQIFKATEKALIYCLRYNESLISVLNTLISFKKINR